MADPADTTPTAQENAAAELQQEMYNILVKNPTDRPGAQPFTINVPFQSTVRDLKELLTASYPGTPPVPSQRIIYAGKLLDDGQRLETVMSSADPSVQHTLHLVVSGIRNSPAAASGSSNHPRVQDGAGAGAPSQSESSSAPNVSPEGGSASRNPHNVGNAFNPYLAFQQYPGLDAQRLLYPSVPGMPPQGSGAYPFPFPPQYPTYPPPPSDVHGYDQQHQNSYAGQMPFTPVDPSTYAAHLQAMEQIIGDSLAAQQNSAQEAASVAAAQGTREGVHARAAAQAAASAAAAAAAMHAQAHVHAMANMDAGLRARLENERAVPRMQNQVQGQAFGFGVQFGRRNVGVEGIHQHHPNQNQALGEGGPRVRRFAFQIEINWSLIMKLILVVYLLGQEGSPRRVYSLMAIALAVYLWQTNRLGYVRRLAETALPNPIQLFEALFPRENPSGEVEGRPSDAEEQDTPRPRIPNRFGRGAVILCFVYSFFYGFVSSLLPAWRPQPLPSMEEVLHPAADDNGDEAARSGSPESEDHRNAEHAHAD